jgi:hypothetical protein
LNRLSCLIHGSSATLSPWSSTININGQLKIYRSLLKILIHLQKKKSKKKKKADSATKIKQEEQTEEKNKRQKLLFDISDEAETFLEKVEEMDISSWNPKTMKEMYLKQNKYLHGINDHLNYFRSDTKVFKDEEEEEDDKDE